MVTITQFTPSTTSNIQLSHTLIKSLYQGVVVIDHEDKAIFANATAEMLLGFAPHDLVGRSCEEFLDKAVCELMTISAGQIHRYTTKLRHDDGRLIPATITITGLELFSRPMRLVTIGAIPHLGPLQDALMMEQRLSGIGTLTASIAHELSTPLSVITTTCENMKLLMERDDLDLEKLAHYLEMVVKNGWRATELVEMLQTYGRRGHASQESNLNEIVENSLLLLADQFRTKWRVHIGTELAADLCTVSCDRNQIAQVLINLLTNARDAMQPYGGYVRLKTWNVPDLGAIAFSVSDAGRGIRETDMTRIFDPFYTTKPRGEGTGLGLFVASEIVRKHRGWIRAQNNATRGATFTVMLPYQEQEASPLTSGLSNAKNIGGSAHHA